MDKSIKELETALKRVKKSLGPEPRKYPPEDQKGSKRGRKRKHQSAAERQRAYRARKKLGTLFIS